MFLNDQETKTDLLYFEAIANAIARLIRETPDVPITIGVHGDWGAGKSSILKMTEEGLAGNKTILCLRFNGWLFQGFEDAKIVLIETIVDELRHARSTVATIEDKAKELLKRVDWFKLAKIGGGFAWNAFTGTPTPDQLKMVLQGLTSLVSAPQEHVSKDQVESVLEEMKSCLKEANKISIPREIHDFRRDFEELLAAANIEKLVVLIDDLDRCLPNTTVETLEAIRLFLFVPRTAFVIAADEAMIEYAVKHHFPDLPEGTESQNYARNYLEKLIQVPFRTPSLGIAETRTYLALLLIQSELGEDHADFIKLIGAARERLKRPWESRGLDRKAAIAAVGALMPTIEQAMQLADQIGEILTKGTKGNPRQIKRFLNSMLLRYSIAEARGISTDIAHPVLGKIMLAERFSPELYGQLARRASLAPDGKVKPLAALESEVREQGYGDKKEANQAEAKTSTGSEDWLGSDWTKDWAAIDPALGGVDLRPYIFVMRDKRGFLPDSHSYGHLDNLIKRLLGPAISLGSADAEIRQLQASDAELLFEALRQKILQSDSFAQRPSGVEGLIRLVKVHPSLQNHLISMIKSLPPAKLGAWAVAGWEGSLVETTKKTEFSNIRQGWAEQSSNKVLQAAAKAAAKVEPLER